MTKKEYTLLFLIKNTLYVEIPLLELLFYFMNLNIYLSSFILTSIIKYLKNYLNKYFFELYIIL